MFRIAQRDTQITTAKQTNLNNQTEGAKNIIKQQKENTNMYEIDKMKKKRWKNREKNK